jgi:hypothetical protein
VRAAVVLFGSVKVVRPAAKREVRRDRRSTHREGVHVMKLELVAGGAAATGAADERALPAIAPPHLVAHGCGDVAAAWWRHARGRILAGAAASAVCVRQDRAEPLVQHLRQLSMRQLVRKSAEPPPGSRRTRRSPSPAGRVVAGQSGAGVLPAGVRPEPQSPPPGPAAPGRPPAARAPRWGRRQPVPARNHPNHSGDMATAAADRRGRAAVAS